MFTQRWLGLVLMPSIVAASVGVVPPLLEGQESISPEGFSSRIVTGGLDWPWEVAWGPDAHLWITEREGGRITRVDPRNGSATVAVTIEGVYHAVRQDGVLGMALHPDLLHGVGRDFVYVAWTYAVEGVEGEIRNRITRYTYDASSEALGSPLVVLDGLPAHDDHLAGRLVFGPDGKLYFSVGDQGSNFLNNKCNVNLAQSLPTGPEVLAGDWTRYQGKILRINTDGSIPADNPVLEGVQSHVFSYGHRNPQGLVFAPDGTLFEAEHGPNTDDEVNRIEAGMNYGWPRVAGYRDDRAYVYANWSLAAPTPCDDMPFSNQTPEGVPTFAETDWNHPDFTPPIQTFFTMEPGFTGIGTIATSGLDIYTAESGIPGWADSLLVASLTRGVFYRMKLSPDGRSVDGEVEPVFKSTNRLRDMAIAPDGRSFYIVTDNAGRTLDASGTSTQSLANPGSLIEILWTPGG